MSAIDQIVAVTITQDTQAVAQDTFSVPLILAKKDPGWPAADLVHTYTSPEGLLTDGFLVTDATYIAALAMYAQTITPTLFKVGRRTNKTLQTWKIYPKSGAPAPIAGNTYGFDLEGHPLRYTPTGSPSTAAMMQALQTQAVATGLVTAGVGSPDVSGNMTLIATRGGPLSFDFTTVSSTYWANDPPTATPTLASDLAAIEAADSAWYGLVIANPTDTEILTAAAWIEGAKKLFVAASGTAAVASGSTTDVASQLKTSGYNRTAIVYAPNGYAAALDAAWLSSQLAQTPGSNAWAFKSLSGIPVDALTANQVTAVIGSPIAGVAGKNGNVYTSVAGVPITQMGQTASGQYLDITVGLDWLHSQIQTNVYRALTAGAKLPYTDAGTAVLISAVRAALDQGITNGLIDGASENTVTAPTVASVSANQRAQRIAPTISFACRLQGALNAVTIRGTVTV